MGAVLVGGLLVLFGVIIGFALANYTPSQDG